MMDLLDVVEVLDVIRLDPDTGTAVWTGLAGTRAALERDDFSVDQAK